MVHSCKKYFRIVLCWVFFLSIFSSVPFAAKADSKRPDVEALLVLDASISMNDSDPKKLGNEAMKMFVDMLSVDGDKLGAVAYTDKVIREKALLAVKDEQDKKDLKDFIDTLERGPYTDISVGLNEAIKILESSHTEGNIPLIILLADGNNSLNINAGRTEAKAKADLEKGIAAAKEKGFPVYTIGLNADGTLNKDVMVNLSNQTQGKFFTTNSSEDLPKIFSEIFADHGQVNVLPVGSFKSNGDFQEVKVNIPNDNVVEANISITSPNAVDVELMKPNGEKVALSSGNVVYSKSRAYSMVKLLSPEKGDWKLRVKGKKNDQVDINLIFNYDLSLTLGQLENKPYKQGDTIKVQAFLKNAGEDVSPELYKSMKSTLLITDLKTNQSSTIDMIPGDSSFDAAFTFQNENPHSFQVKAEGESFYRETEPITLNGDGAKEAAVLPAPKKKAAVKEDESSFPWLMAAAGVIGVIVLAALIIFLLRKIKGDTTPMMGQFSIEVRDNDTYDYESPQYRQLDRFSGKTNFFDVMGRRNDFQETRDIEIVRNGQGLMLINKSKSTIEKDGGLIDVNGKEPIYIGDRFTINLTEVSKTVEVEYTY
ncbi:VWA domain-containing protein [Mesobacillus jeotgali]|uniref:VWA domain-containing protein n=1 Tax=Mesobacillus jeotgali TaxID=129985 RepID=UPI001CFD2E64|nr:vWA domain-containing protein [Mesobacillus jeotgali]